MEELEHWATGDSVKWCTYGRECMAAPQNIKVRITVWSSNFTCEYTAERTESRDSNRYLYAYVYGNIIYSNQKVETA